MGSGWSFKISRNKGTEGNQLKRRLYSYLLALATNYCTKHMPVIMKGNEINISSERSRSYQTFNI